MNFGAILRSAYFFGVERLIVFNSCPLTSTVSKASAGVMEVIPIYSVDTAGRKLQEFFTIIKEKNWSIVTTGSKNELAQAADKIKHRTTQSLTEGNMDPQE